MKIKFNQDVELQVIEGFDDEADEVTDACMEMFRKDEVHDVDIVDEEDEICTLQFGDGSCSYCVQKAWFEIL